MPSPVTKKNGKKMYHRKGGGYRGKYSIRNLKLDAKRKARKGTREQLRKYPHAFD